VVEILALVIQFLIEVVGTAIFSIPFDCACRIREKEERPIGLSVLFLTAGGMVGGISAAFVPSLVEIPALKLASLVVTPLVAGTIGYHIAKWQARTRNPLLVPRYHFWYTFFFTLGLVVVRFAYLNAHSK
jgi:hypothetical protein